MHPFGVAIRLWFRTVLLTGLLYAAGLMVDLHFAGVLIVIAMLTIGFVVTFPLLLIIVPVVGMSRRLPYNNPAKISFVTFGMVLVIMLFYGAFGWIIDGNFISETGWLRAAMGATLLALLFAVVWTRRSFLKLYADI
jgi:hypothetical protein